MTSFDVFEASILTIRGMTRGGGNAQVFSCGTFLSGCGAYKCIGDFNGGGQRGHGQLL